MVKAMHNSTSVFEVIEETEEGKATVIVRRLDDKVSLGLSFEHNGDFEVFLNQDEVEKLIAILSQTKPQTFT